MHNSGYSGRGKYGRFEDTQYEDFMRDLERIRSEVRKYRAEFKKK